MSAIEQMLAAYLGGDEAIGDDFGVAISRLLYFSINRNAYVLGRPMGSAEAADIRQDILEKLLKNDSAKLRSFTSSSQLSSWLETLVYRHLIDLRRSATEQENRRTDSTDAPMGNSPDAPTLGSTLEKLDEREPWEIIDDRLMVSVLREAVGTVLDQEERAIIELWCSRDYTTDDLARLFSRPAKTISTKIHRALAKILAYVREKLPDSVYKSERTGTRS